ncbi:transposase [Salmonirosea aquatica]|uniref:transposase n=1 Tax=Salmonirosea aquatica TaxID=2654236 RepID=UPI00357144A6
MFIKFSRKHCVPCVVRKKCTKMKRRGVKLRADAHYQALQAARKREGQESWPLLYCQRAGIEGTLSQAERGFGLPHRRTGRSRYTGLTQTHLQNIFVATAINLYRLVDWLNEVPLTKTRQAAFVRLIPQNLAPN